MKKELRVLMVEDTAEDAALIHHALRKAGLRFRQRRVDSREAFLHELEHHAPDIILSDHGLPNFDGFAALAEARSRCPGVPFIFVTGAPGEQAAEETLQSGADDYVLKSRLHLLGPAIERVIRDVGTRKRHQELEAALEEAEEHLDLLASELKEYATFLVDTDGRVASWSSSAARMLGYEPNAILGQHCEQLFSCGTLVPEQPKFLLATASLDGRTEEVCWCARKTGEPFRANVVVVPLRGVFQKTRGFLCILRDLTLQESGADRLTEAPRAEARQLEDAHREMEHFTHAIANDLRTPLQHIESFVELLNKRSADSLDQKSAGYLKTIADSARQMGRLVDELFNYARIGRTEMHRLHVSLGDLVKEVKHDLRHETEGREIEWVIGALPEVSGDPVMLWMVMTNLISNALKFTRPRKSARIEIGSLAAPNEHIIFVRDNGVGFDNHYAARIFGVFQRLHTTEFEGTGVGLANVRRIIQRHGGRTWAEGSENEGASFYFSLPR
jgi:PAS domain S-box-containing protein